MQSCQIYMEILSFMKEKYTCFFVRGNKEDDSGLTKAAPYWTQITIHMVLTGEISHGTALAKAMEYCKAETGSCIWYDIPEKYWERAVRELTGIQRER